MRPTTVIHRRRSVACLVAVLLAMSVVPTASVSAEIELAVDPVRTEIAALLDRLAASGCRFQRNGQWYAGEQARDHLQRKLDYLAKRTTLTSTEQFIELAATRSSLSGQAYQVQCGEAPALASSAWLLEELGRLRESPGSTVTESDNAG